MDANQSHHAWRDGNHALQLQAGLRTAVDQFRIAGSAPNFRQNSLATRDTVDRYPRARYAHAGGAVEGVPGGVARDRG